MQLEGKRFGKRQIWRWNIMSDEIPELLEYMKDVSPEAWKEGADMISEVVVDVSDYLGEWRNLSFILIEQKEKEQKFDFASIQMKGFVVS